MVRVCDCWADLYAGSSLILHPVDAESAGSSANSGYSLAGGTASSSSAGGIRGSSSSISSSCSSLALRGLSSSSSYSCSAAPSQTGASSSLLSFPHRAVVLDHASGGSSSSAGAGGSRSSRGDAGLASSGGHVFVVRDMSGDNMLGPNVGGSSSSVVSASAGGGSSRSAAAVSTCPSSTQALSLTSHRSCTCFTTSSRPRE